MAEKLVQNFYSRSADVVAPDLLGKILAHETTNGTLKARIVETEAYLGAEDQASHAYRGETARNSVMFGPPGILYVYFTYGLHYCINVVTAQEGIAEAVLIRAAEPVTGLDQMKLNRGITDPFKLCNGPAKLAQALGLNVDDNGASLLGDTSWIEDDGARPEVTVSARVGISKAIDAPLRFYVPNNKYVSKPNKNRYNKTHG